MDTPDLLSRFETQTILVLGDVVLDENLSGDCSRLSPEAPVPVLKVESMRTNRVLGGAANTAANVASLGGKAILIGRTQGTAQYAHTAGELQTGARGLAAPVLGVDGLEASVGIVTLGDLDIETVAPRVVAAAAEVARRLS